ncbi:MAG: DUF6491 family protein [Kangiellaceae bacterium]
MKRKIALNLLIIISVAASGCSSLKPNKKESIYSQYIKEKKLEPQKRITSFRFHGWRSLDNEHLILNTTFSKPYLIDLAGVCFDLSFSHSIAIHNTGSSLQAKFDSISVPDNHEFKCRIESIYKITRDQAKELSSLKSKKSSEAS